MPHQSAPEKGFFNPFYLLPYICLSATILILLFPEATAAQAISSCANADFEQGDFTNWQGQVGNCCPVVTAPSGIVPGRHTIMSGTGTDPNTCGHVAVVAPGGHYSARIGNAGIGAEAEKLSYVITVSAESALFIYKYAVVLEDPGHPADEQPRFQVRVADASGQPVDPVCGEYTVVASSNLPGFATCNGTIIYKDWTTVGLDLSAYIGQTLTIEFITADCKPGAHFGYAYVDAYCSPLQIESVYCSGSSTATLNAPVGFGYLWSTGETTPSITIANPMAGQNYTCQLTSVTGCSVRISTVLSTIDPVADFVVTNACYTDAAFSNVSTAQGAMAFAWDFGDGTTSDEENPKHSYTSAGNYNVTLTISNGAGCIGSVSHMVAINGLPKPEIADGVICTDAAGNVIRSYLLDTKLSASEYTFEWFFNTARLSNASENTYTATAVGNYAVIATNILTGCQSEKTFAVVGQSVVPDNFIAYITDTFTDEASLVLVVEGGTGPYLFSIDGGPFDSATVYTQLPSGTHSVRVTDANGCTNLEKEILVLDYPRFFTPNNDGIHDSWNIFRLDGQPDAVVYIYDRYGKLLKQISPSGQGWNGVYDGHDMPSEDYWFTVDYKETNLKGIMEQRGFHSHFSLKR